MERRSQMVIDQCTALGDNNPIIAIHDVGAGGISNALPELVHDAGLGAIFDLRKVPCSDPSMSPMEIWCNESQERYVLAIQESNLNLFKSFVDRERCPMGVVGVATKEERLVLKDSLLNSTPIDLPMSILFGKPPKMHRVDKTEQLFRKPFTLGNVRLFECIKRVLQLPTVASKSFLITIGDRSVTGLVARDQLVGPWQTPVSDVAVILSSPEVTEYSGQAMAMGEKSPLALLSHSASAKMAVAESLTNLAAAHIPDLKTVRLSANWMSAASHPGEGAGIYEAVKSIGLELCPALGITIPVGKDSMSMKTKWNNGSNEVSVTAPMSVIITAFAPVIDARLTLTPQLQSTKQIGPSLLLFIDLAQKKQRLGGSCVAQVFNQVGSEAPNVESASELASFWNFIQNGRSNDQKNLFWAYHDRSDGGLLTTVLEMCFAGRLGCELDLSTYSEVYSSDAFVRALFNEELGAVIQIKETDLDIVNSLLTEYGLNNFHVLGKVLDSQEIRIKSHSTVLLQSTRHELQKLWSETSYQMQSIRDNPECALAEFNSLSDLSDPGIHAVLTFDPSQSPLNTKQIRDVRPKVAVLREQGVNSHLEMAYAFYKSGFDSVDVHMSDVLKGKVDLDAFIGLACPGGFSYGDVLGAGTGWAKSILLNSSANAAFKAFFKRPDTFTIGICNGCQMLSQLAEKNLIPGASNWPNFKRNLSEQFEGRVSTLQVSSANNSFWFKDMQGSRIPVAVAHGEGRAVFRSESDYKESSKLIALQYIQNNGDIANPQNYPLNPNGSIDGIAGLTSDDGRVLILMPHPERVVRGVSNTWGTFLGGAGFGHEAGWMRLFHNARVWVQNQ